MTRDLVIWGDGAPRKFLVGESNPKSKSLPLFLFYSFLVTSADCDQSDTFSCVCGKSNVVPFATYTLFLHFPFLSIIILSMLLKDFKWNAGLREDFQRIFVTARHLGSGGKPRLLETILFLFFCVFSHENMNVGT